MPAKMEHTTNGFVALTEKMKITKLWLYRKFLGWSPVIGKVLINILIFAQNKRTDNQINCKSHAL